MAPDWALAAALLGGTRSMREAGVAYLPKWPAETAEAYKARLSVSVLFPAYQRTVSTLASKPFSKPIAVADGVPQALKVLTARIHEKDRSERAAVDAAMRKGLVGSGDRSDRIRTYNFPQGRLTDHRINLTLYKLAQIMDGDLSDVVAALTAARAAEQLAQLEAGNG